MCLMFMVTCVCYVVFLWHIIIIGAHLETLTPTSFSSYPQSSNNLSILSQTSTIRYLTFCYHVKSPIPDFDVHIVSLDLWTKSSIENDSQPLTIKHSSQTFFAFMTTLDSRDQSSPKNLSPPLG